jgi:hypothetical protein
MKKNVVIALVCCMIVAASLYVILQRQVPRTLVGERINFQVAVKHFYERTGRLPKDSSELQLDYSGRTLPLSSIEIHSIELVDGGTRIVLDYECEGRPFHSVVAVRPPKNLESGDGNSATSKPVLTP